MSEDLLTYIIVFAEIGGVLLLVSLISAVFFVRKSSKDGNITKELIAFIKKLVGSGRDDLVEAFNEKYDENEEVNIETLLEDERKLYQYLIKFSINKDTSLLKSATAGIHSLIGDYVKLLSLEAGSSSADYEDEGEGEGEGSAEKKAKHIILQKENEALRIELAAVEAKLKNTTATIENMMGEFSSMYEGGKKEGEQKVKNEMYKLKQELNNEDEEARVKIKKMDKEEKE